MKNFLLLLLLLPSCLPGQLTSLEIRQVSGRGPYPIYGNFQVLKSGVNKIFGDFLDSYSQEYQIQKYSSKLWGIEGDLGIAMNNNGWFFELGYQRLARNVIKGNGNEPQLRIRQEAGSIRFGKRYNIFYPITLQWLVGGVVNNTITVEERLNGVRRRVSLGGGSSGGNFLDNLGIDMRIRVLLFDPVGTTGGLGAFVEVRSFGSLRKRSLDPFHRTFVGRSANDVKNWNTLACSAGIVVPFAVAIPSRR